MYHYVRGKGLHSIENLLTYITCEFFGLSVLRHVAFQITLADKTFVTQVTFELSVLNMFLHGVPFQCGIKDCFQTHITKD